MNNFISLPPQKISQKEKNKKWKEECVDSIISISYNSLNNKRRNQYEKQINYDLINGIINDKDFLYATDPFQLGNEYGGQPAKLESYPLIQTKVNVLCGEELKRRFRYRVVCTGGQGQELKEELKVKYLKTYFKNKIYSELNINPEKLPEDFQEPSQILQFFDYKYEDLGEIYGNRILKQLEYEQYLKSKFNKGFKHAQIVAEEIYYASKINDKPNLRVVDPRFFWFYKSDESDFIEDSYMCKEERWLTKSEIIDEFKDYLTDDQVSTIDKYSDNINMYSQFNNLTPNVNEYSNSINKNKSNLILVNHVVWKSLKEIVFLYYVDDKGKKQIKTITDVNFKLTPEQKLDSNNYIEKKWITDIWQGIKIGNELYINIEPVENQVNNKMPYLGGVYNDLNSTPTSLVDYLKVYQHTYNILWYRFKLEIAKAQGKKLIMDMAQIPRTQGISVEKWLYYFQTLNVVWINSAEEGFDNSRSGFNQFKDIDLSLSQSIGGYLQYMQKIETMMNYIVGISPQRESNISPYETSSGIQQAIQTSSTITEPFFYQHDLVKRNVLSYLVQLSKFCYKEINNRKMTFLNSDLLKEVFEVDTDLMMLSDYGTFIADNTQDDIVFDVIKQNAQSALNAQLINFSELVDILKTNSVTEAVSILKKGEEKRSQNAQQQQEAQQQMEQQKIENDNNNDFKNKQFDLLVQKNDNDTKIRLKQMDISPDFKEAPDNLTYKDVITNQNKQQEVSNKYNVEKEKQLQNTTNNNTKNLIKMNELKLKEKQLNIQLQIAKENQTKSELQAKRKI